ncbi:MAG: CoA transferase [Gammaproteobacteria bacterium]|nr:CoA transferase [Gammaproteobacteria bacterium]MDH4315867.1 CoA transferase [Gammaproteobacteria bacterium]MDH5214661.1 CoA transferase [Gammaproteobacteria bacterium]
MSGPLSGIRIVDLSRVLAGPWASQLLADFGAEVIKIEKPGAGDDTRHWGPPWLSDRDGKPTRESAYFLATNRNKLSITANLSHPEGQKLVSELASQADVLLENFRVGTLAKFRLDAANLQEQNPRLIYCSISAYGQQGSRRSLPGYDAMMQAEGGLMSITGEPATSGGQPQKVGVAIADIMTGMYAATAILAALEARHTSGEGQYIDLSLYHSQVAWLANQGQNFLMTGVSPGRLGTAHPNIVPYQSFRTADGYVMLAVGNDRQFAACVDCMGIGDLANDARYASNEKRVRNRDGLITTLSALFQEKSTAHWLDALAKVGVPAGRINDIDAVLGGDYASEAGLIGQFRHSLSETVPMVTNPVNFSATPVERRHAGPLLGEHTEQILTSRLGYSIEKIAGLRDRGAI